MRDRRHTGLAVGGARAHTARRNLNKGEHVATAKKGVVGKVKDAITGLFEDKPERKSPKRVQAGRKAAVTAKANKAVKSVKRAAKKAVTAVTGARKGTSKKSR